MEYKYFFFSFFLIFGSLINIYYYLNIFFNVMLNSFFFEIFSGKNEFVFGNSSILFVFLVLVGLIGLGLGYVVVIYAMVLFYKS